MLIRGMDVNSNLIAVLHGLFLETLELILDLAFGILSLIHAKTGEYAISITCSWNGLSKLETFITIRA